MQKLDDSNGGGNWSAANIKRDAGAAFNNKAVRIFVVLVALGALAKHFYPAVVS
jgi:hypothetical protein